MIAHPMSVTTAGFFMSTEPYILITNQSPAEIGAAVRRALSEGKVGIRTPRRDEYPNLPSSPVQRKMREYRGARTVRITQDEELVLLPHLNGGGAGPNRGYHELPLKKIALPMTIDDAALGAACFEALARCE